MTLPPQRKVRTVGDCYIAASGIPEVDASPSVSAEKVVRFCLALTRVVATLNLDAEKKSLPLLKVRVGIASGPVVAGVVGLNKFCYDCWGDTVNMAARMEQNSESGKVHLHPRTRDLVKHLPDLLIQDRGLVEIKGKGQMHTYWVKHK